MMGMILDNLGTLEQGAGDVKKAQGYFEKSLEISRGSSHLSQMTYTLNNLASLALSSEESSLALKYLDESLRLAKDLGMTRLIPFIVGNLAIAAYKLKDYEKAQVVGEEALVYVRESGERWLEGLILAQLGESFNAGAKYKKAEQALHQSLLISYEIKHIPSLLHVLAKYAELFLNQNKYPEAFYAANNVVNHKAVNNEDRMIAEKVLRKLAEMKMLQVGKIPSLEDLIRKILRD